MLKDHMDTIPLEKFNIKEGILTLTLPSILVEIAANGVEAMNELKTLSRDVMFGGAPLPVDVGDKLANNGINLHSGYGM